MASSGRLESRVHVEPIASPGRRDRSPARATTGFARRTARTARPAALASTAQSRARLSFVLLVYLVAVVAIVELAPFGFGLPNDVRIVVSTGWRDALTSLLLFVPLGFLYPLTRAHDESSGLHVVLWAALVAALILIARIFELERDTALVDLIASAVGADLGRRLLAAVNRRTRASARLAGRLSLEIPLIGLIYLLLPLVLATSLSAADDPRRMLALLPLGLLGARLLSGVQEYHFGPARVFTARSIGVVAAGWTALGVFPAMFPHPLLSAGVVLVVGVATLYDASRPALHGAERRFEADILRSAAPFVAVYFLDALLLPLVAGVVPWHGALGLTGGGGVARQIVGLLEPLTALALLGYLLAEARGRRELPFRRIAWRVGAECAAVAIALEASRGIQRGVGASGAELALMIGAAVLGAGMYHHQRERVRWMLIHQVSAPAPKPRLSAFAKIA